MHTHTHTHSHAHTHHTYAHTFADTIDKWDEEKLKEVVEKKHGEKSKPKTDIVSQREDSRFMAKLNWAG